VFSNLVFSPENRAGYEKMWKNMVARQATYDSIMGRTRIACWITKATSTHREDVILTTFARQQWLREGVSQCSITRTLAVMLKQSGHCGQRT
jgi:hypothetical protein